MASTLKLPVGIDSFEKIRRNKFYYIDKTKLIEQLVETGGEVTLFTRPRRFGKTLNMSMLKAFFETGADESLFDGLYISNNKELCDKYETDSILGLKKALMQTSRMELIDTYKKIELSRLSKGERQIFILALYWAIIMISGQDIPFIIDTPYARIDANHRKEISEKFFPNISKQVVILSTDEEINEEYYKIIHPYVAKEYLLTNDESINKTTVENKYFFEV